MKKHMILVLAVMMLLVVTACDSSNGYKTSSTKENTELSKTSDETDGSWTEYPTRSEAEAAVGFSFSFGEMICDGAYCENAFRVKEGIMEVTYIKEDSTDLEDQYVIRQSKKVDGDISGDSNSYSHDFTVDDCGIDQIRLRGTKDSLAVCSFDYGEYSYAIYPGPMDYEETFRVIGEMTGIESTEYTADDIKEGINRFVGEWYCEETTLEDADTYTGYYELSVDQNGQFSIYDKEAGNPGISGSLTVDSDSEVTVDCEEEDFDPPAGWMDMSEKQTLQYEFEGEEELHLSYTKDGKTSTLVFHKENTEE